MWTDLATTADDRRDLSVLVQPGMRAVTIRAIDHANQLIQPGDRVDVIATRPTDRGQQATIVLMQNVLVMAVGLDTGSESGKHAIGRGDSTLTVSVTISARAQLLSLAGDRGRLSVALRNPDDVRIVDGLVEANASALVDARVRASDRRSALLLPRRTPSLPVPVRLRGGGRVECRPAPWGASMKRLALAASLTVLLLAPAVRAQTKHHPATRPTDPPAAPPGAEPEVHPQISRDLALAVGETKTISAVGVANYSEGTPGVVEVKLTGDASQFIVVGQRPGSTSLVLIGRDGTQTNVAISVFARSPQQVEAEIGELIDGYTGLRVRRVGSRFFIEGGVSNEGDLKRVELIAHLYPGQVESLVGVGAGAADRSTDIRIDVFFVQYSKDSSYNVGLTWPSVISTTGLQSSLGYNFITQTPSFQAGTSVNQPLPGLDIAAAHGWAKVLKQATVITTNGVEAKLGNGGEQNFLHRQRAHEHDSADLVRHERHQLVPRFDPQTRDLEVEGGRADISTTSPRPPPGTSLPGRQTANLTTLVHLKLGQSIVLSGIHTLSKIHAVSGIPGLSQIPILGLLFGVAQRHLEQETEGAIFIVPSVMDLADKGALEAHSRGDPEVTTATRATFPPLERSNATRP